MSSYRTGYPAYLQFADTAQLAALALPGVAGIVVLTGVGALIGYRQAKAGFALEVRGSARFMA